jgi:hypothetical protein
MKLDPKAVQALFDSAQTQADYINGLYAMVHPDYKTIKHLDGWPVCSTETWKRICGLAQAVDNRINERERKQATHRHLDIMPGGAWLNMGFSTRGSDKPLELWEVIPVAEEGIQR